MAHELTIKDATARLTVSVTLNVNEGQKPIEFRNTAFAEVQNMDSPARPTQPFVTYRAIESACISGALYARRKLGIKGLAIDLLAATWTGELENAEPFAIAVMIGATKGFAKDVSFSESDLNGWSLAAYE